MMPNAWGAGEATSEEEGSPNWPSIAGGEFLLRLAVDATVMTMNRLTPPGVGPRDYCADDAQCLGHWGGDEGARESVSY